MSLRHRLPLTYGLIALLAALALGAALLLILRGFYSQQERAYLAQNGEIIAELFVGTERFDIPAMEQQLQTLAFLTQTRIRVFDAADALLIDSGAVTEQDAIITLSLAVEADDVRQAFSQTIEGGNPNQPIQSDVELGTSNNSVRMSTSSNGVLAGNRTIATPFNFGSRASTIDRSNQVVRTAIPGIIRSYGGYVELSDGPAFGATIVRNVSIGLLGSGSVAIVLATLVGVGISRRITQSLLALTEATEQMATGDLAVRSGVMRGDEIGRLSITFNSMAERIETTVSALQRFVADAAHEIHTPLTALRTNLELAEQHPHETSYIAQAQAQTKRLQTLTESLLQLSRLESEELSAEFTPVDITALLQQRSEFYAAQAEQHNIGYVLNLPTQPLCVDGNREQLQRVIDNLLDNALKFSVAEGDVAVALSVKNSQALLTVSNSSIGIDGNIDRIFDRFHRAPNAAAYPGNGLGLAIVQRIVAAHHGAVAVEERFGRLHFTIALPTKQLSL